MSLLSALNVSAGGLRAAQGGIDLASRNVANASTAGYTAKRLPTENLILGGEGGGVLAGEVARDVDQRMIAQLRLQTSAAAAEGVVGDALGRIDEMFGRPEDETSIAAKTGRVADALQTLATTPESAAAREAVLAEADSTARSLNALSDEVQAMRLDAETGIAESVDRVNAALASVAKLNADIAQRQVQGVSTADLEDRRDLRLEEISAEIEIRTARDGDGRTLVFTPDGSSLVGREGASALRFDARTHLEPASRWSANPEQRGVGTITLGEGGGEVDLIASDSLTGGRLAGLVQLRDDLLTQTQAQLDEIAHQLATATSAHSVEASEAAGVWSLDMDALVESPGDRLVVTYTAAGQERTVTLIASETTSGPAAGDLTARPGDQVRFFQLGASSADAAANAAAELAALAGGPLAAGTTGSTLEISGAAGIMQAARADVSLTELRSGDPDRLGLPLFADMEVGQEAYTGSFDGGAQKVGFAGRIAVDARLADDPEALSYALADAPVGDAARPLELGRRMGEEARLADPATGIGGRGQPFAGTVGGYARAVVSFQGAQAARAEESAADARALEDALSERVTRETGVNIDQEMARLMELEQVYAANARLMTVVDELFDQLFAIAR